MIVISILEVSGVVQVFQVTVALKQTSAWFRALTHILYYNNFEGKEMDVLVV